MDATATNTRPALDVAKIVHVYSGIADACACGCKGKHTYASSVADKGQAVRGYAIGPEEVNDTVVRRHVGTINAILAGDGLVAGHVDSVTAEYVSVRVPSRGAGPDRMLVAYFADAAAL